MKCNRCKKEIIAVDCPEPGEMYHVEDTEWGCAPQEDRDPGLLVAKPAAVPSVFCKGNK